MLNKTMSEEFNEENPTVSEEIIEQPTVATVEEDEPIEKPAPARKPRSKAQQEAFAKAQKALQAKRAKDKQDREANRKPRGRPKKVALPPDPEPDPEPILKRRAQGGRKATQFIIDEEYTSSDSEPEQIVVKTRRRPRVKKKRQPEIIYISQSESESEEEAQVLFF